MDKKQCQRKNCGVEFAPTKPKQIYCSDKCRTYAYREYIRAAKQPVKKSAPKTDTNINGKTELEKLEAELEGLGNSSYLFDYKRKLKAKIDKLKNP